MGDASDQEPNGQNQEVAKQATAATVLPSILDALTCLDNTARNGAEQAFNGLKDGQPEDLVYGLLEVSASPLSWGFCFQEYGTAQ